MKFRRRVWYRSTSSVNARSSPFRNDVTTAESSALRSWSLTDTPNSGVAACFVASFPIAITPVIHR
jgi:hypothetical protein